MFFHLWLLLEKCQKRQEAGGSMNQSGHLKLATVVGDPKLIAIPYSLLLHFFYHKLSMCTNDQLLFWIIFTPPPSLFLHLSLHPDRKLKKLVRAIKDKGSAEEEREEERPPQQWNLDYALAPFEGLTPEYMEMSESALKHSCLLCLMLLSL